ncbi:MAG: hypothetical protein R2705_08675 [Ilumatobacteraceae bacterium]
MPRANRSELPDSTGHAPPERLLVLTACGCLLLATLGACSRGDVHDLGAYCAQLAEQQDLVSGSIGSREDIATVTSVYESLQAAAPIDVEQDWQRLLDLIQTAATVDLADQSAQADLDAQAYRRERPPPSTSRTTPRPSADSSWPGRVGCPPEATISVPPITDPPPESS